MPNNYSPSISAILMLTASISLHLRKADVQNSSNVKKANSTPNSNSTEVPWILFMLIFGVYITAGITYAGIYPQLTQYNPIERYYNVLPFIIAIVFASRIADSKGRKPLLYIGISFLGLSFVFYSMTPGLLTYFLIQTTLQAAWAFLDLFAWVILADIASKTERPEYHHYGLSLVMAGVMFGSFLSIKVVNLNFFTPTLYSFIAHLPLFMAVALLGKVPETLKKDHITPANEYNITELNYPFLQQLTSRENEIIVLLLDNLTNPQICELLSISANTLKTHLRNIYRKTETLNKKELRTLLLEEIQGDPRVFGFNSTRELH